MSRRPEKVLRWAWSPSTGASLEPPASDAAAGWATGVKPAAQHMNALLNNSGAWIDFLRGPSLNRWSRVTTGATLLTATLPVMAADRISVNTTTVRRRVVVAGEDSTGLCVLVSRRGDSWTLRRNFPGGLTGHFSRIYCLDAAWYLLVDDTTTGALLVSPRDGETGTALDGGADWTEDSTVPAPGSGVDGGLLAAASGSSGDLLVARRKQLLFITSGSGSWTTLTSATGGGGYPDSGGAGTRGTYSDVAYDGSWYVAISTHGDVVGAVNPSLGVATRERITLGTGLPWRLAVGASGELVAWLYVTGSSQPFYRSTDHGSSWERLDPTDTTLVGLTSLTYADGQWVASSTAAPYVWSSSDLVTWTPAVVPYVDADAQSVYGMALSEGGWVAARTTTALVGARGEDPSGGAWSTDPTPTTLGNAGWITGRRIASTAPTSGQVLTWSAGTSQWVPADSAGGSSSPTTTSGDMIYRGASVDQRLAIGTSGQVLRVSAGAPAWGTLAASDVGAVAAPGSASTGDVLRWSGSAWASYALAASDVGAAPTSRAITAGTGLTGGGDLSADRTIAVSFGTSSSTACVGDDARLSDTRTPSATSVTLSTLAAPVLGLVETTVTLPIAPGMHAAPTAGSEIVGLVYFLPSRYAVSGLTTTISIEAVGYVEGGTLTLDVLDVTSGYTGASSVLGAAVTWTETDPTRKTASITLPGSGKIYAATISKNTSAGAYLSALNLLVARS